jgi:hypothetical protein
MMKQSMDLFPQGAKFSVGDLERLSVSISWLLLTLK